MDEEALYLFSVAPDSLEFELDGYYGDALVKCYLQKELVSQKTEIYFDSESSMLSRRISNR